MSLMIPLKALADEKRLNILVLLIANDLCVGALAKHLGISKPAVSQHLRILRKAGLVKGEKRGYWTHYAVDRGTLKRVAADLNALAAAEKIQGTICWRAAEKAAANPNPEEVDMCQSCCQQTDKQTEKPENCSPEQIRRCHGDADEHPCLTQIYPSVKKK